MAAFAASHPAELPVQSALQGYVSVRPEDEGNTFNRAHTVAQLVGGTELQVGRSRVRFPVV